MWGHCINVSHLCHNTLKEASGKTRRPWLKGVRETTTSASPTPPSAAMVSRCEVLDNSVGGSETTASVHSSAMRRNNC